MLYASLCLQADYTYVLPYTSTFLDKQLAYDVKLWVNDAKVMRRIDVYNGLDVELDRDVRGSHLTNHKASAQLHF